MTLLLVLLVVVVISSSFTMQSLPQNISNRPFSFFLNMVGLIPIVYHLKSLILTGITMISGGETLFSARVKESTYTTQWLQVARSWSVGLGISSSHSTWCGPSVQSTVTAIREASEAVRASTEFPSVFWGTLIPWEALRRNKNIVLLNTMEKQLTLCLFYGDLHCS